MPGSLRRPVFRGRGSRPASRLPSRRRSGSGLGRNSRGRPIPRARPRREPPPEPRRRPTGARNRSNRGDYRGDGRLLKHDSRSAKRDRDRAPVRPALHAREGAGRYPHNVGASGWRARVSLWHDRSAHGEAKDPSSNESADAREPAVLAPPASFVGEVGGVAFRRFGFVQSAIVSRWSEIVGERYARVSSPESIRFPTGRKSGGALTLLVEGRAFTAASASQPADHRTRQPLLWI